MSKYSVSRKLSTASPYSGTKSILRGEEILNNLIVIPPDGGWGWMIVLSSFLSLMIIDGIIYSLGLFLSEMGENFDVHPSRIATACSVMTGCYYIAGPLTCALTNRFGFRLIGFIGSILSSAAFALSSIVTILPLFILIFGLIGGLGCNMIFAPSILAIGFYFERWRALATSIAVCGTSVGVIVFPPMITQLFSDYSWREKFRILSGLCCTCGIFALAYKPIPPVRIIDEERKVQFDDIESTTTFNLNDNDPNNIRQIFRRYHNTSYPTASEYYTSTSNLSASPLTLASSTLIASVPPDSSLASVATKSVVKSITSKYDTVSEKLTTVYEEEDETEVHVGKRTCKTLCAVCFKKCFYCCCPNVRIINRPMYRDDIFFKGSLYTLPEYSRSNVVSGPSAKKSALDYHLSVSRVPTQQDLNEAKKCVFCPEAVLRTLVTMLDLKLLKSPSFLLISCSGFFTLLGVYIPFLFIVQRAETMNIDSKWTSYLLSIIGISNTLGRIVCGIISSFPNTDNLSVSYGTIFICGVMTIASNYLNSLEGQIAYAVIFGGSIASASAIRSAVLVDLVGLENLTNAFGITMLFEGGASFLGVPIASFLEYFTGSYNLTFMFSGICITFSAILMMPIKWVKRWEHRRQDTKSSSKTRPR